ncbi:hypothetical protein [Micromonospora sp. CPCC 205558]|uniref:hypothetical protein n=1 Tax=Micromonospora sp. CPCC 205558 TaxID=3122403 RepID=UPI002FF06B88
MFDHDTDSYYKISRALLDGVPTGALTRESIVDKVTLYWLTGTSSARWRWEFGRFLTAAQAAGQTPPPVSVPDRFHHVPRRDLGRSAQLGRGGEADRGGHFAAWEEPELFAAEVRAVFRPLRGS